MNHFENNIFSLTKEEKVECKTQDIPKYYWYYLQIQARGQGLKELKELIQQRITPLYSESELKKIVGVIAKKIREMVRRYNDGQGQDVEKLNRKFNSEVFPLIDEIMSGRKPKANADKDKRKKPITKKAVKKN